MSEKAKKVTKISIIGLIGIFATGLLYMADLVYYPAFYGVMMDFPDASMGILNFNMTGSQLAAMLASFLVIPLMKKFDKKSILLVETAIFAVTALCAPLVHNITYFTVMRTLTGLGFGGMMGVSIALIQQVYRRDKKHRDRYVGWYNAIVSFAGAINGSVGGILAAISWQTAFKYYWLAPVVFVVILICVPRTLPDNKDEEAIAEAAAMAEAAGQDKGWQGKFISILLATLSYMFINIIYMGMGSGQLSVILAELGLGGEVEAGWVTAIVGTIGGFVSIGFAPAFRKLKRFTPVVCYGFMILALIVYCFISSWVVMAIGFGLAVFGYAGGLCYYFVYSGDVAPASKASTAITMITIGMTFGAFIAPYFVTWTEAAIGASMVVEIFPIYLIAVAVAFIISIITAVRSKKRGEVFGEFVPEEEEIAVEA